MVLITKDDVLIVMKELDKKTVGATVAHSTYTFKFMPIPYDTIYTAATSWLLLYYID